MAMQISLNIRYTVHVTGYYKYFISRNISTRNNVQTALLVAVEVSQNE